MIPRLYGGDVTTRSTLASARRDIPVMQSSLRRSNLVTAATCIGMGFVQPENKARISGEHRLAACAPRRCAFARVREFAYLFSMADKPSKLKIADREFASRLLVGTGKFASNELMRDA